MPAELIPLDIATYLNLDLAVWPFRGYVLDENGDKEVHTFEGLGHTASSKDYDVVTDWLVEYGDAIKGWGIPTGSDTLLGVDLDAKHNGLENWRTIVKQHANGAGPKSETWTVRTPNKGMHLAFEWPEALTGRLRKLNHHDGLPRGVEIFGEGHNLFVPPTAGYETLGTTDLAPTPAWLVSFILEFLDQSEGRKVTRFDIPDEIPEGTRHNTMSSVTLKLANAGLSEDEVFAGAMAVNGRYTGSHEVNADEIREQARSAVAKVQREQAAIIPRAIIPRKDAHIVQKEAEPLDWTDQIVADGDYDLTTRVVPTKRLGAIWQDGKVEEIYAPFGGHKTNIVLERLVCVAAGIPWATDSDGEDGIPVVQSPCLYINADMPEDEAEMRIEAFKRGHGIDREIPLYRIHDPRPALNLLQNPYLLEHTIRHIPVSVWVVDSLSAVSGARDELGLDLSNAVQNLTDTAKRTMTAGCYLHHPARMGKYGRGNMLRLRSIERAVEVEKISDSVLRFDDREKRRGTDAYQDLALTFTLETEPDDPTRWVEARFVRTDQATARLNEIEQAAEKMLRHIERHPGESKRSVYAAVRGRQDVLKDAIDLLEHNGKIRIQKGKSHLLYPSENASADQNTENVT